MKILLRATFFALVIPMLAHGQAELSTTGGQLSVTAGIIYSETKSDYFSSNPYISTFGAYSDLDFAGARKVLGLEGDWHSLMAPQQSQQNSFLVGPRVGRRFGRFVPYARGGAGIGMFNKPTTPYPQQNGSHFILGVGGGVDIDINRHFTIRGFDYEHQRWSFYPHSLNPSLFSVGIAFRFR